MRGGASHRPTVCSYQGATQFDGDGLTSFRWGGERACGRAVPLTHHHATHVTALACDLRSLVSRRALDDSLGDSRVRQRNLITSADLIIKLTIIKLHARMAHSLRDIFTGGSRDHVLRHRPSTRTHRGGGSLCATRVEPSQAAPGYSAFVDSSLLLTAVIVHPDARALCASTYIILGNHGSLCHENLWPLVVQTLTPP